ncbi:hypothetical protein [Terrabacter sp. 2YAF2]|uniref:hypothetical protein n=1 Tax=Terrabacter sp. 2YAF2 TaxID=3233026 RepID=UPI003F9AE999
MATTPFWSEGGQRWHTGSAIPPAGESDPEGAEELFELILDDSPQAFARFARDFLEMIPDDAAINAGYQSEPLDPRSSPRSTPTPSMRTSASSSVRWGLPRREAHPHMPPSGRAEFGTSQTAPRHPVCDTPSLWRRGHEGRDVAIGAHRVDPIGRQVVCNAEGDAISVAGAGACSFEERDASSRHQLTGTQIRHVSVQAVDGPFHGLSTADYRATLNRGLCDVVGEELLEAARSRR